MKQTIRVFRQGSEKYYFRYRFTQIGDVHFPLEQTKRSSEKLARTIQGEIRSGVDPLLIVRKYHPSHRCVSHKIAVRPKDKVRRSFNSNVVLVGDVLDLHELFEDRLEIREMTANRNRQALIRLILVALSGKRKNRLKVSRRDIEMVRRFAVADLGSLVLMDFKAKYVDGAIGEEGQRRRRAANSTINQARSIFSATACEIYTQEGLNLPSLTAFKTGSKFRRTGKGGFRPPDGPVIRAIFELWSTWVREALQGNASVRNRAIALTLGLHLGLRRSETARIRRCDLRFEPPGISVGSTRTEVTKTGIEMIVPTESFVIEFLNSVADANDDYLLRGNMNVRTDLVFREIASALRSVGVLDARPYHMMRKLYGSSIAATEGLLEAQIRLGHESPQITFSTYARVQMAKEILALWKMEPRTPEGVAE